MSTLIFWLMADMARFINNNGSEEPFIELRDGVFYLRLTLPFAGPIEVALHGISRREDALLLRRIFLDRLTANQSCWEFAAALTA